MKLSIILPGALAAWSIWVVWFLWSGHGTEMSGLLALPGALPWSFVLGAVLQLIPGSSSLALDQNYQWVGIMLLAACHLMNIYVLFRIGAWWDARG